MYQKNGPYALRSRHQVPPKLARSYIVLLALLALRQGPLTDPKDRRYGETNCGWVSTVRRRLFHRRQKKKTTILFFSQTRKAEKNSCTFATERRGRKAGHLNRVLDTIADAWKGVIG